MSFPDNRLIATSTASPSLASATAKTNTTMRHKLLTIRVDDKEIEIASASIIASRDRSDKSRCRR